MIFVKNYRQEILLFGWIAFWDNFFFSCHGLWFVSVTFSPDFSFCVEGVSHIRDVYILFLLLLGSYDLSMRPRFVLINFCEIKRSCDSLFYSWFFIVLCISPFDESDWDVEFSSGTCSTGVVYIRPHDHTTLQVFPKFTLSLVLCTTGTVWDYWSACCHDRSLLRVLFIFLVLPVWRVCKLTLCATLAPARLSVTGSASRGISCLCEMSRLTSTGVTVWIESVLLFSCGIWRFRCRLVWDCVVTPVTFSLVPSDWYRQFLRVLSQYLRVMTPITVDSL